MTHRNQWFLVIVMFMIISGIGGLAYAQTLILKAQPSQVWESLGSAINHPNKNLFMLVDASPHGFAPALGASKDKVYVAYTEFNKWGVAQVRLKEWEGLSWKNRFVRMNMDDTVNAFNPTLAMLDNVPFVAWTEYDTQKIRQLYVKRLFKNRWISLGESKNSDLAVDSNSPVLAAGGQKVFLAWIEGAENAPQALYLRQIHPLDEDHRPDPLNRDSTENAFEPTLIHDGKTGYLSWSESLHGQSLQIHVRQIGTQAFPFLGNSLNVNPSSHGVSPSIAIYKGVPYVTWVEIGPGTPAQIFVKHWDKAKKKWIRNGFIHNIDPRSHAISPSLIAGDGFLYLAWEEMTKDLTPRLHLKRFNGESWKVAAPSLPFNPNHMASTPVLAFDQEGLLASWKEDNPMGVFKIRVSRLREALLIESP